MSNILLGIDIHTVDGLEKILFLPIEFFKPHKVVSTQKEAQATFTSSKLTFRHYVLDLEIYEASFIRGFEDFYGDVNEYCISCTMSILSLL